MLIDFKCYLNEYENLIKIYIYLGYCRKMIIIKLLLLLRLAQDLIRIGRIFILRFDFQNKRGISPAVYVRSWGKQFFRYM